MHPRITQIKERIQPIRESIVNHALFQEIKTMEDIQLFMQHHVYAVWDFMSLLKSLQRNLTCIETPWFPTGAPETRFLINEIVVGEESDVDANGLRTSHFELYLDAMQQANASTDEILRFCNSLQNTKNMEESFAVSNTPESVRNFVRFTFQTIHTNKPYLQAAIFTFGREDLIPNMFYALVNELNKQFPDQIAPIKYYLDRHIEVDGDHHSHLAIQMTEELCGTNDAHWDEAETFILASLEQRKLLWDGVLKAIQAKKLIAQTH